MNNLLNDQQLTHYARHIMLDNFGIEGQQALFAAHLLIIGAGGLGCAVMPYLATAGIGTLTIVDHDLIELSNLQRQILFHFSDIGRPKALVAKERLLQLNPTLSIQAITQQADDALLDILVAQTDLVLDCTDNFFTRQTINRACVAHRIPLISGSVTHFLGQISTFDTRSVYSPCYACVFPAELQVTEESCALMGVFSPAVALIGATQAAEALKLLTGIGSSLIGKLLRLNTMTFDWTHIQLSRDANCTICAAHYDRKQTKFSKEPKF